MNNLTIPGYLMLCAVAYFGLPDSVAFADDQKQAPENVAVVQAGSDIDAGRYIAVIGGCNDCHTANWGETNGNVPEADWLTGVPLGWRGPWGTTYASNLRLLVHEISEDAWVAVLRARAERPPMPWANVNRMSEPDSRAVYRFIRSLGIRGDRMPVATEADVEPEFPYLLLEPLIPRQRSVAAVKSGPEN